MKKIISVCALVALCALFVPSQSDGLVVAVSPRLALPVGDFGDLVSTGFGWAVSINKEVKGKPGRVGLVFLAFPEGDENALGIATSVTAIGAFAG